MQISDQIIKELEKEEELFDTLTSVLKGLPMGSLSVKSSRGRDYFTAHLMDGDKYLGRIPHDQGEAAYRLIHALTTRFHAEKMRSILATNIRVFRTMLKRVLEYDPNVLLANAPAAYRIMSCDDIEKLGFPDYRTFLSEEAPYNPSGGKGDSVNGLPANLSGGKCASVNGHQAGHNGDEGNKLLFREGERTHITASGIRVRSRAEVAIADTYTIKGIPYYYEKPLILPNGTELHPDFTVYVPSKRRFVYHEFAGMLGQPEYIKSFIWKEHQYIKAGLYPNRDYFVTCEEKDGSIDMGKLSSIIDEFLK